MGKQLKGLLAQKIHDRQFEAYCRQYVHGRLVDIGCGPKPYRAMMAPLVQEHVGVDHEGSLHDKSQVDLIGTAYAIPAPDGSFNSAICTAVLEHLEEPEQAIRECFRVLRSGGTAIYTAPFIWPVHEAPRDFYRYSKYGLSYLFKKAGFEVMKIEALSGFWVTFGQQFVYNIYRYNRGPLRYIPIIPAVGLVIQGFSYILDRIDKSEDWTWMYLVIARRP